MNLRLLILLFILLVLPLFGRPKTDTLVMKNGDRFTCEVKRLDRGVLYAGLDYVDGTISIDWAKVARIESSQLFVVQTQDGSIYEGAIKSHGDAGRRARENRDQRDAYKVRNWSIRRQIIEMTQSSDSFWRRFSGNLDSGMIYAKGNNTAQYNLASELTYRRERWNAGVNYSSSFSTSNHETASTRNQLGFDVLRLLRWNNWYYTGVANFLQSSQQGINLQSGVGGGVGRFLKNTDRTRISLTGRPCAGRIRGTKPPPTPTKKQLPV